VDSGLGAGGEFVAARARAVTAERRIVLGSDARLPATAGHLADDIAAGRLIRLDCDSPETRTRYSAFHLRDRTLLPPARAFIDALRAVEAQLQREDIASRKVQVPKAGRIARSRQ
jgi:DNA-binding transcriptional LysR family regulator